MDFDHVHPLPLLKKTDLEASDAVNKYFRVESQFMADDWYVKSNYEILRRNAVRIVLENYKAENFDAFIPYLAMNYFDRYVSNHGLPQPHTGKRVRDEVFLISLCCLTIAWKMRDKSFSIPQFLEERSLDSKGEHIMKVELKVLGRFNWQIRPVTPFCFVDFYAKYLYSDYAIRRRSINEIIVQTQGDIYFTHFKPSLIAACALLAACSFLYPTRYPEFRWRIGKEIRRENQLYGSNIETVFSESNLLACLERIINMCIKIKILIESAQPMFGERERARVLAREPPRTTAASSSSPRILLEEETNELQRRGGELEMQPMKKISEEIQIIGMNSEITEELDSQDQQMNFEIKWITEEDEKEDLTINSPLFQRRFYDSGDAGSSVLGKCKCNVL